MLPQLPIASACRLAALAAAIMTAPALLAEEAAVVENATPPGITTEKPADGRYVEIDGAYMVPYTETIPGTEVRFEMVPIPGGEFLMGSPDDEADRSEDEGPQVRVRVEPFWIGKTEVTWAEYKSYMAMYDAFKKLQLLATNRAKASAADDNQPAWDLIESHAWMGDPDDAEFDGVTSATPLYDSSFTYSSGEEPNLPAVTMTQFAARQYTKWLSGLTGEDYRLPSEAEWEYAARAGSTTPYSFGDSAEELGQYAWFDDNADYTTHPVAEKEPNPWGLYDVHGNVAEWTLDEYQEDAYGKLNSEAVAAGEAIRWPTKVYPRAIRGGSYLDTADRLRSAARLPSEEEEWKLSDPNIPLSPWWYTEDAATGVGMRIVRPLKPIPDEDKPRVWDADVEAIRQDVEDRLAEGRGALGRAGETLPAAVEAARTLEDQE